MRASDLPDDLRGALVVAVDDSPPAREALRWAAGLATGLDRTLHVLSVWNFITGTAPSDQAADETLSLERWQAEAERRLAALVAEELGDAEVRPVVLHGNTTPVLLATSELADHLVVGSRGRGGFTGLLLGSTSEQVVRHGSCPVTVVRHGCTAPAPTAA